MKPVYVVSGWMRSGTSMMMKALEAGGMEACYRQSRDVMKNHYADEFYDPNPTGLYELERRDYAHPEFPRMYAGKLIKALQLGPANMRTCEGGIKVVFMRRIAEESRQSYQAFFGSNPPAANVIEARVERSLEAVHNRRDTEVLELWYTDVIAQPVIAFTAVRDFFQVSFDVATAAGLVDPSLYRFRLPELVEGIL